MSEADRQFANYITPFGLDHPSSVWDAVQYQQNQALGKIFPKQLFPWKRWPGAPNYVLERDIWACETGWYAYLKFSEYALLNFFWTSFIPSHVEIERKVLLGSYKCGFYFLPKFKSPLSLIIGEDGVSVIAKFARPLTTVLFWWWAAETAWSALDTAQTILYKEQFCDDLATGFLAIDAEHIFSVDTTDGQVTGWNEEHDPDNRLSPGPGVALLPPGHYRINFSAHFVHTAGTSVSNCAIWLNVNGEVIQLQEFDDDKVNEGLSRMVRADITSDVTLTVSCRFRATRSPGAPPFAIGIVGDIWAASWS